MIKSFKNKGLRNFFYDGKKRSINPLHLKRVESILERLEATENVEKDMNSPRDHLHKLEPKHEDRWSVSVMKNWVVTFVFKDGNAYDVDYLDYH